MLGINVQVSVLSAQGRSIPDAPLWLTQFFLFAVATLLRLTFRYGSYGRHVAAAVTDIAVSCQSLLLRRVTLTFASALHRHGVLPPASSKSRLGR